MQISTRSYIFWIALTALFCGGAAFSYHYFSRAFPIVNLNISIDRDDAITKANELAKKQNWGPATYQAAASFSLDNKTKNFIELEGGGKKAFNQILADNYYAPYTWKVRHFQEGNAHETKICFTPDGRPYGFTEKIAEDTPGAALSEKDAQKIAEQTVQSEWGIAINNYTLVEASQEKKPSGRIDHTFVYERPDIKVGDAPYRRTLIVSGDKLTKNKLSIKIPEAFTRRYAHMRSANNAIANGASIIMILLYIICGCFLGLIYLMRRRWVLWKYSLLWGFFIGLLQALNIPNELPLAWMKYDTALAKSTFFSQLLFSMGFQATVYASILALIFAAAEGLTRKAFGHHPQLWKAWSPTAAASYAILGRTIGGYLILGFDFAFVIAMYWLSLNFFGWWIPSETLINPDVLSTYLPWFSSIARSLHAGFVEECVFRAVPLASAALLGKRWGKEGLFVGIAFILQAIIFGAAHANYPAQPAYARLVELIIPSFVFAGMYLRFGLLPSIISHFVFDVVWFALPLFVSTASGIWINQLLVILFALVPLWIVLAARLRQGSWHILPASLYNMSWQAPPALAKRVKRIRIDAQPEKKAISATRIAACAALFLWLWATPFTQDGLPLAITKQNAFDAAQGFLNLGPEWNSFTTAESAMASQDRFVWQNAGKKQYQKLMGSYLEAAAWRTRFAQFDTDIVTGAEEYNFYINGTGNSIRRNHELPESQEGKTLSQQEARSIAQKFLANEFNLKPTDLEEISAVSSKKPNRLDWIFTFKDAAAYPEQPDVPFKGEARILIEVAGDQVVDHFRHVFVPQEWKRMDTQRQALLNMIQAVCSLLLIFFFLLAGTHALMMLLHHEMTGWVFLIFFLILLGKSCIQFFNIKESLTANFSTSQPYGHQFWTLIGKLIMQIVFKSALLAFFAQFICSTYFFIKRKKTTLQSMLDGTLVGIIITGIAQFGEHLFPATKPLWADYVNAAALSPALSIALVTLTSFISTTILLYLIFYTFDMISTGGTKRMYETLVIATITGILLQGALQIESIPAWLIGGALFGILFYVLYQYVIRFDHATIPSIAATYVLLSATQQTVFNAFLGVIPGFILSVIFVTVLNWMWTRMIKN